MIDFGIMPTAPTQPLSEPRTVAVVDETPVVHETVTVAPRPFQGASHVTKDDSVWGWQELRDYVLTEIEKRHGPQVRDYQREASIFKSFMSRWPDGLSVAIAKAAFSPVHDGMWRSAPISVNRFCKASDPYFAQILADRI